MPGIPESTYREHVLRARSTRNHFTFSRDFVWIMTKHRALFLQDIVNRASGKKTKRMTVTEDGLEREYFMCARRYLLKPPMKWDEHTQKNMLKYFQDRGLIRVIRKCEPGQCKPQRWIWIDILQIETEVSEAIRKRRDKKASGQKCSEASGQKCSEASGQKCSEASGQKCSVNKVQIEERLKKKESSRGGVEDSPTPPVNGFVPESRNGHAESNKPAPPDFCMEWANTLRRILITKVPSIAVGNGSRKSWAGEFLVLCKKLGGGDEAKARIQKRLDQYAKHINSISKPDFINAKQFCKPEMFHWLERELDKLEDGSCERAGLWTTAKEVEKQCSYIITKAGVVHRKTPDGGPGKVIDPHKYCIPDEFKAYLESIGKY